MKDLKHETYNDGVVFYGEIKTLFNSYKKKIGEEFSQKGKLFFKELSAREADVMVANDLGYKIDKKIKTYSRPDITRKSKVKINNELYDIVSMDKDKINMYLYLQRVGD